MESLSLVKAWNKVNRPELVSRSETSPDSVERECQNTCIHVCMYVCAYVCTHVLTHASACMCFNVLSCNAM